MIATSRLQQNSYFFAISFALIILATFLRFYQLGAISGPVFDEVYFPEYAYSYIIGDAFFHVHPPLYNYISSFSIWFYHQLPWVEIAPLGTVEFAQLEAISYRWINAVAGTALVGVTILTLLRLTKHKTVALLAGLFVAIDGSIVVDSRFGMNNIFLILFGLLAIWAALKAHQLSIKKRRWLITSGIFFGCTICIKWNGLGYLLALLAFLMCLYIWAKVHERLMASKIQNIQSAKKPNINLSFKPHEYASYLLVLPFIVYSLLWIPDRLFNTEYSFIGMQQQIMGYHSKLVSADEHSYCSKWYSWPIMQRPIAYHFSSRDLTDAAGNTKRFLTDVHLFGNPALYWFSTIAILVMCYGWLKRTWHWYRSGVFYSPSFGLFKRFYNNATIAKSDIATLNTWAIYTAILLGYFANLTPWALVERCAFLYHYQSASVFGFFALSWYLARCLHSTSKTLNYCAYLAMFFILAAFVYWLPFVLGIELSQEAFYQRMWFSSWI